LVTQDHSASNIRNIYTCQMVMDDFFFQILGASFSYYTVLRKMNKT